MTRRMVLAAVDAEPAASAVLRASLGAGAALGVPVRVISVVEPLPRLLPGHDIAAIPYATAERERYAELHGALRAEAAQQGAVAAVTFCTMAGGAPASIREAAHEWGADLVVLGFGRTALTDRVFGGGVALKVARDAPSPVLVVPHDVPSRPAAIVALVDFSAPSRRAAHVAADLAIQGSTLHLLHAIPEANLSLIDAAEWRTIYELGAHDLLAALRTEILDRRGDLEIELSVRSGHPVREASALADASGADLIAMGRHSHDRFERMFLGSSATAMLQTARHAVLIVPPAAPAPE